MWKSNKVPTGLNTINKLEDWNSFFAETVDETLKQVFKEEGTRVIYDYLENNSHLKREEIAEKTKVFSAGLEKLLSTAAPMIEKLILKNLHSKLGLKFVEKKGYRFTDYVEELRKRCGL